MAAFMCRRCQQDAQPANFATPRNCAFTRDGSFTVDNWNCATLEALASDVEPVWGMDETLKLVPGEHPECPGESYGWLVLTRYKRRGRCSSLIWVGDFYPPRQPTLSDVERAIALRQRRS